MIIMSKLCNLHTCSIDFVLAYPRAESKATIYLLDPQGVIINCNGEDMVLKLKNNLYGLKDAGRTWWEHLSEGLEKMGFRQCQADQCVWMKDGAVIVVYVEDCLVFANEESMVTKLVAELKKNSSITDEGKTIEEYLGVKIVHNKDGSFRMYQPLLINRIIKAIPGMDKANEHTTPATSSATLTKDTSGKARQESWNYRSISGMLNFLVDSTHPELSHAVHQCARFCSDPKASHETAIKQVIRYLLTTQEREGRSAPKYGINMKPDKNKGLEVYVDASFSGEWNESWSDEPSSVMSRTGYVIKYANCPIVWSSKLQTEITLSTTEAEYVALSQAMREVIPLINLLNEIKGSIRISSDSRPEFRCAVFEDNNGCIELAKCPRMRPRTKHIAIKYHHFRNKVEEGVIRVLRVDTKEQQADLLTKNLARDQFLKLRQMICGW